MTSQNLPSRHSYSDREQEFELLRRSKLELMNSNTVMDAPFLYMDRILLASSLTRIKLFEMIKDVQGSIVECGVFNGNSLMLYQHLSSIYEPISHHRKIVGFDTFAGFPSISEKDPEDLKAGMVHGSSKSHLLDWIKIQDLNRSLGNIEKIELIEGDANVTIPKYVEVTKHLIVSLLYLDFDLYEPTLTALKNFLPLMPKGGVVAFDELNQKTFFGETVALKEVLDINKLRLTKFYFEPNVSYYVIE